MSVDEMLNAPLANNKWKKHASLPVNVPGTYSVQVLKTPACVLVPHYCKLSGGERGAELSLSLWYWDVFMLQLRPREDSSDRTFRETVHPSFWRSYYTVSFEVVASLCDAAKAVWSSSFFLGLFHSIVEIFRVPAHLSTETPHWAICHLPWKTSTLKICAAAAAAAGRQCTTIILLYTAEW